MGKELKSLRRWIREKEGIYERGKKVFGEIEGKFEKGRMSMYVKRVWKRGGSE